MKSKVIVLITLFVIASLATLSAQTKKAWQKAADESFQEGDYFSAYEYYQITLEFDSTDLVNRYRLAESARNYGSFAKADTAYQKLIQVDTSNRFPIAHFWRGEMNRYLGKYNLAKASYQKFLQLHSRNSGPIVRKAKQSIENCEWAQEEMAKQVQSPDTILHAGNEINSPYSDFAPALYGDSLYFSSFRFVYEKDTLDPPRPYIKIMKAVEGDKPKVLDDRFNIPTRHAAHTAFNLDYSRVFYTLCDYTASSDVVCELYSRERLYTGEWGEPVKLNLNLKGYTSTQPNVGFDSTANEERLYFVSDRPIGSADNKDLDIWYATINPDGSLEEPKNFAEANTPFDEATPFFHTASQTFYFSSEAYKNLGGFDIFKFKRDDKGEWPNTPESKENLGIPVNSSYNDLYYSLYWNGSRTYFSSNRPDSVAIFWDDTKDACCNDIYYQRKDVTLELLVNTFNLLNRSPLPGVKLEMIQLTPNGEIPVLEIENPDQHVFKLDVLPNRTYVLKATREDFTFDTDTVDMRLPKLHHTLRVERDLYLAPATAPIVLNAFSFDLANSQPLDQTTARLLEVTPNGLKPLMSDTASIGQNDFHFPLLPNKQYLIEVERDGYTMATATVMPIKPTPGEPIIIDRNLFLLPPKAPSLDLQVNTYEEDLSNPLTGVNVDLFEVTPIGLKIIGSKVDPETNQYTFPVLPGRKYVLKGGRKGYTSDQDSVDVSVPALIPDGIVKVDLILDPPTIKPLELDVLTYDSDFTNPLAGTTVYLYELTPNGPQLIAEVENPTGNDFNFPLLPGKIYQIKAVRDGYTTAQTSVDTRNPDLLPENGKLQAELLLIPPSVPSLALDAFTFNSEINNPLPGTTVELYELTPNGPQLIARVPNPTGNDYNFNVLPGKKYQLVATRDGYTTAQTIIDTADPSLEIENGKIRTNLILIPPTVETLALEALTFDASLDNPLPGTTVELYELTPNGPQLIARVENPVGNDYNFPLLPGKQYQIIATRDGYTTAQQTIDTTNPNLPVENGKVRANLLLIPPTLQNIKLEALTFDTEVTQPLEGTTVNLYEITPTGPVLIATRQNATGNDYDFPLLAGKKYELIATRNGYTTAERTIDTSNPNIIPENGIIEAELILIPPTIPNIELEALTFNTKPTNPLPGTRVELYEITPTGPVLKATTENPVGNDYSFNLLPGKEYKVVGKQDGYITAEKTLNTKSPNIIAKGGRLQTELILIPPAIAGLKLEAKTFNNEYTQPLPGTKVELYEITPTGPVLKATRENSVGNNFEFELLPGKIYRVVGTKPDFTKGEQIIDTRSIELAPTLKTIRADLLLAPPSIDPVDLKTLTFNKELEPLQNATVQLYEIRPTGPVLIAEVQNPTGNDNTLQVLPGREYRVVGKTTDLIDDEKSIDITVPELVPDTRKMDVELILDKPLELDALTFFKDLNQPLEGTVLELYEMTPEGPKLIASFENPTGNDFNFPLVPGKKYLLKAKKDGFTTAEKTIDVSQPNLIPENGKVTVDLVLDKPLELDALTFHNTLNKPLDGTVVELYEMTPDGPKLVARVENQDGNDFHFPIMPGKKYKLIAKKDGFIQDEQDIDVSSPALIPGTGKIKVDLVLERPETLKLEALTFENNNSNPLNGTILEVYEVSPTGPKLVTTLENPTDNLFDLELLPGKKYLLRGKKNGFITVELPLNLTDPSIYEVPVIQRKLILSRPIGQIPMLEIFTYEKDTLNPLSGVNIELIKVVNDLPQLDDSQMNEEGNDYLFPVELDRPYVIIATKPGFEPLEDTVSFSQLRLNPITNKISMNLKLNPYSLDNFLPLALYFDNDRPDPSTYSKVSTKTYPESFERYYGRREDFVSTFIQDMEREQAFVVQERLRSFFERDVLNGNVDLLGFTDQLVKVLEGGSSVNIQIKGFTSPKGNARYNDNLSARRIDCVINHFEAYRGGVLKKFLKNKQLTIEKVPLGESTIDPKKAGIADDNSKSSIYAKVASVERRVEIIQVKAK